MLKLIPFPEIFPSRMELRISASYPISSLIPFPIPHMQPMDKGNPMLWLADVSIPNDIMGPSNVSFSQNWDETAAFIMSVEGDVIFVCSIIRLSLCSDVELMLFNSGSFRDVSAHTDQWVFMDIP